MSDMPDYNENMPKQKWLSHWPYLRVPGFTKYIRVDVVEERLDNLLWIARNARQVVDVIYEFIDEAHEEDVPDGFAYVGRAIADLDDQLREHGFPPTESVNEEKYRAEVLGE